MTLECVIALVCACIRWASLSGIGSARNDYGGPQIGRSSRWTGDTGHRRSAGRRPGNRARDGALRCQRRLHHGPQCGQGGGDARRTAQDRRRCRIPAGRSRRGLGAGTDFCGGGQAIQSHRQPRQCRRHDRPGVVAERDDRAVGHPVCGERAGPFLPDAGASRASERAEKPPARL